MSDQQDRVVKLLHETPEQRDDFRSMVRVEISGRLIGENNLGLVHNRPCDRDTLLFPTRQFARTMSGSVRHPHQCQHLGHAFSNGGAMLPPQEQGKRDVLFDGETRDQMKGLKDNAN